MVRLDTRNPLTRTGDRVLSSAATLGFVLCLLAVSIALVVGTTSYTGEAARIRARDEGKSEVLATVVTDPVYVRAEHHSVAEVQWRDGSLTESRTAPVGNFAFRGAPVHIWLTADGTPTDPPVPAGTALLRGIGDGAGVALAVWFSVFIGLAWCRSRLDRNA